MLQSDTETHVKSLMFVCRVHENENAEGAFDDLKWFPWSRTRRRRDRRAKSRVTGTKRSTGLTAAARARQYWCARRSRGAYCRLDHRGLVNVWRLRSSAGAERCLFVWTDDRLACVRRYASCDSDRAIIATTSPPLDYFFSPLLLFITLIVRRPRIKWWGNVHCSTPRRRVQCPPRSYIALYPTVNSISFFRARRVVVVVVGRCSAHERRRPVVHCSSVHWSVVADVVDVPADSDAQSSTRFVATQRPADL